jgi:predicted RNase H-like HicB family nuclease
MSLHLKLEYWKDGPWFVGRLPHMPGVFSQGATLEELEENIRDAYRVMLDESASAPGIQERYHVKRSFLPPGRLS